MTSCFKIVFFILIFFISTAASKAFTVKDAAVITGSIVLSDSSITLYPDEATQPGVRLLSKLQLKTSENKKITAFFLAVFLGHFGVHRLYLGTEPIVPIAYVLTLGGGLGVLPAIDAIVILFSKDLEKFENNSRFFMWNE